MNSKVFLIILIIIFSISLYGKKTKTIGKQEETTVSRSIFSIGGAYASPFQQNGYGWGIIIRSKTFISTSDFYWGIVNYFGGLPSTNMSFFDCALTIGYRNTQLIKGIGFSLALEVSFGSQVDINWNLQGSLWGVAPVFEISFLTNLPYGFALSISPVFKLGNQSQFQMSYFLVGITFQYRIRNKNLKWKD